MDQTITIQALMQIGALIAGAWGFFKVIMEIVKAINARHDKEQAWDKAVEDFNKEREDLKEEFNLRLDDQDAKIQQLFAMIVMLMKAQNACLEGLIEQGCNGNVKKMHAELNEFITEQIGR